MKTTHAFKMTVCIMMREMCTMRMCMPENTGSRARES